MKTIYQKIQAFQSLKISIPRNAKAYNYNYATLDKIFEIIQDKMTELSLIVVNSLKDWELTTTIIHTESGESVQSSIRINDWLKPQDVGSAITYYRRYNIGCLLNLIIEDDDDGQRAMGKGKTGKTEKTESKPRFNDSEFAKFEKVKSNYSCDEALKLIKSKYQISQVMETKVLSLYNS